MRDTSPSRPAGHPTVVRPARPALGVLAALTLAACAPPRTRPEPEPEAVGASAAYTCAYRRLRDMGYTLTRTAPEVGTVAGQRIVSPPLAARTAWDEVVVTTPVGARARGPVRAAARGGVEEAGRRRTHAPTERARTDARRINDDCKGARRREARAPGGGATPGLAADISLHPSWEEMRDSVSVEAAVRARELISLARGHADRLVQRYADLR